MTIEVIGIGDDLSEPIGEAIKLLNTVQDEFVFKKVSQAAQSEAQTIEREEFQSAEIWSYLENYREKAGGQHPFILAFVNRPLSSEKWSNLFGSHQAKQGLAVATTDRHAQFVNDAKRYVAYFMVRYTLSFINPDIHVHDEPSRKECYFHLKQAKAEIRHSMDTGKICDVCIAELDKKTSPEQRNALKSMRDVVSGQYPLALIMKGGGIKGLAFAGALLELEKYFSFDIFVGTSAGAISAILLGAGYTPREIEQELSKKDFSQFLDASWMRSAWNLITISGLYDGDSFQNWLDRLLSNKVQKMAAVRMEDLNSSIIYACRAGDGTMIFDSRGKNKDSDAAFAARCSMSIPIFFKPMSVAGRRVYDGGMRNNFPVAKFIADNPHKPFLALYLGNRLRFGKQQWLLSELCSIAFGGDELSIIDDHVDKVVIIDPSPISTLNFKLTVDEAAFLTKAGKAAAMRLILNRKMDPTFDEQEVLEIESEVEHLRIKIKATRRVRRRKLLWKIGLASLFGLGILVFKKNLLQVILGWRSC